MNRSPFSYNEAINPRQFIICSLELRPFCLGHYILLEQIQSPFITDDPNASAEMGEGLAHFLMCLLVCSQTYEDNVKMLNDWKMLTVATKALQKNLFKSMKKDKQWNIYHKLALFKDYIRFFTEMPIFQVEQQSDRVPSGIDWKQNLFTIAKNEWGYTDAEILNMPLRRLFFEWCSYAEKGGGIRVQNSEEMDNLEYMMGKK
jgi:signal transduction histidine kinase